MVSSNARVFSGLRLEHKLNKLWVAERGVDHVERS